MLIFAVHYFISTNIQKESNCLTWGFQSLLEDNWRMEVHSITRWLRCGLKPGGWVCVGPTHSPHECPTTPVNNPNQNNPPLTFPLQKLPIVSAGWKTTALFSRRMTSPGFRGEIPGSGVSEGGAASSRSLRWSYWLERVTLHLELLHFWWLGGPADTSRTLLVCSCHYTSHFLSSSTALPPCHSLR